MVIIDFPEKRSLQPFIWGQEARSFTPQKPPVLQELSVVTTQAGPRSLANKIRLKIIRLLAEGEKCVDDLVSVLGLAQSSVSHHLRVLKEAGLVQAEKRGRCVYYSIAPMEGG